MHTISCKDMGMEGCEFVASGETAEDAMKASTEHGMADHAAKMAEMKETMSEDQMKEAMTKAMKTA